MKLAGVQKKSIHWKRLATFLLCSVGKIYPLKGKKSRMEHGIRTIDKFTFKHLLNFKCTIDSKAMIRNHHLGFLFWNSSTSFISLDRRWEWIGWVSRVHYDLKIKHRKGGINKKTATYFRVETCDWKRWETHKNSPRFFFGVCVTF